MQSLNPLDKKQNTHVLRSAWQCQTNLLINLLYFRFLANIFRCPLRMLRIARPFWIATCSKREESLKLKDNLVYWNWWSNLSLMP